MADSFFGFDTTLMDSSLDGLDCPLEDDVTEEEEYDALNNETFGSEATIGDWEQDHEKLAQITESSRAHNNVLNKNGVNVDIENSLSHLVLDEKEGTVPKPGVWDSPSQYALPKFQPVPAFSSPLKNVCTVEELERGLIGNRPPPGLSKPLQPLQPQKSDGSIFFDTLSLNEKLNGLPAPPRFPPGFPPGPHPVVIPPNIRLPHPQFIQNPRLLPNQAGNVLRYPLPPHLMLAHGTQRQLLHGPPGTNFPPPHPNVALPRYVRDHPMIPLFPNNQNNHQHFSHGVNQRAQNPTFHRRDQQVNHQPFFKNNQHYIHNHNRNNQLYHDYHQGKWNNTQNINGINISNGYDEYAGLMSTREKQWLTNIQLLQLNTNQPYIDDYYYTVFCDRQNKKNENKSQDKKQQNNGFHRESRDRDQSHTISKVVYTPTQFENSLGKLQCGSVTAPRKIIDMDVVPNSDPQNTIIMQQKDSKKTRQLLLEIERLYTLQLKLEDISNPLALLSEQQQQQQQEEGESETETQTETVKKTAPEIIIMMWTPLLLLIQDDKIASMLSIRKAKMLLLRFLPFLDVKEYSNQLGELWTGIFHGLAIIGRRDSHLLFNFYPEFQKWLSNISDFKIVLRLAKSLNDSASQASKNNSLAFALANKFGISAIASMIVQAETLFPAEESLVNEWSTFIKNVDELIDDSMPSDIPYDPIQESLLINHLKRISGLKSERYSTLLLLFTQANHSR
ncbi:protein PAT1 homolog 1 isoform X2 [Prorops nasuta]|uniref:protein PAT1 homolog 1 isoform X2 n=1 Tax=Prorops nasuta TaxID=863751 RepID=UPI0034CEBEDF